MKAKVLDQFYTNPKVAKECYKILEETLDLNHYNLFLEPSAGNGSFLSLFPSDKRVGIDLDPQHPEVIKQDFFQYTTDTDDVIVIGNPPFGKRSKLAIEFFKHAAKFSDVVAFIVPLQWHKWSVQSKIPKDFKLIKDVKLKKNSFLFNGEPYDVRCCFQIWSRGSELEDLRIKEKPRISHPDFTMYLYNNTRQAEKFFYTSWDFAVPRQGYQDYSIRMYDEKDCSRRIQWIFIKAKDKKVLEILKNIDYEKLSHKNTSTPGWGKADLVAEYEKIIS